MSTSSNPLKTAMLNMKDSQPKELPKPALSVSPTTPPSRRGKKVISGHFEPLAAQQLKFLAVEQGRSIQSLLEESINDLFRKYEKSSIA